MSPTPDLNAIVVNDLNPDDTVTVTLTLNDPNAGILETDATNAESTFSNGILTLRGTVSEVNVALDTARFVPAENYTQDVTLTIALTDGKIAQPISREILLKGS